MVLTSVSCGDVLGAFRERYVWLKHHHDNCLETFLTACIACIDK